MEDKVKRLIKTVTFDLHKSMYFSFEGLTPREHSFLWLTATAVLSALSMLILLASHSSEDIEMLCDQVFEMDAGILGEREEGRT